MKTTDVISHFQKPGEKPRAAILRIAETLSIRPQSIYGWEEQVPELRALQLEKATKGKLKAL